MKAISFRKAARYFISAAGIFIGIAAAMVILGVAEGGRASLYENFWHKDVKIYDIELKDGGLGSEEYLIREDGRLLSDKMPEVKGSIPVLRLDSQLKSYKATENAITLAVNERYQQYANLKMLKGSFINEQDVRHVNKIAVIDDLTALELFGTTEVVGQKLDIQVSGKRVEFIVAGVCSNYNKNIETLFDDEIEGMCFIPDSVPEDVSFDFSVEKLIALVDYGLHKEEAVIKLCHLLEREHGASEIYDINEYDQLAEVAEFTDKYLAFAVIIAIVALISGSVGVMNAMLLTIQERKMEIGMYKFYGSGIRELQYDVFFKTLVICLGSGLFGMLLGLTAGGYIGSYFNIGTKITYMAVSITTGASAVIGIASSLYPAVKISRVDASEAIWGE